MNTTATTARSVKRTSFLLHDESQLRSASGTKSSEPGSVTLPTKAPVAFLGAVSFQEGRGRRQRRMRRKR